MTGTEAPLPAALSGYPEPFSNYDLDLAFGGAEVRPVPSWRPTDDSGADWAMRKLAETVHAARPISEQAQAWRERIDQWEEKELAPLTRRMSFFQGMLMQYGLEQRDYTEGKRKTINLPGGSIATRGSEDERLVIAQDQFMECMRSAPPGIRDALTRAEPRPVKELAKVLHRYNLLGCVECGSIVTVPFDHEDYVVCPECQGRVEFVERMVGIPQFGLNEDTPLGIFRVEGAFFEAPPAPSATVRLADERALPRPT